LDLCKCKPAKTGKLWLSEGLIQFLVQMMEKNHPVGVRSPGELNRGKKTNAKKYLLSTFEVEATATTNSVPQQHF